MSTQTTNYLNLDILFHRDGDHYAVRARNSVGNESSRAQSFTVPFTPQEQQLLTGDLPGTTNLTPQQVGQRLFEALFQGEVRDLLVRSHEQARAWAGLRLRLHVNDAAGLARLPWEYLYDATEARFLALTARLSIVRYLALGEPPQALQVEPPLRVLVVMANPTDIFPPLNVEVEWQQLQTVLAPLVEQGIIELVRLPHPTRNALADYMEQYPVHVLHFVGHGDHDTTTDTGGLFLEDEQGAADFVPAPILQVLLVDTLHGQDGTLRLTFLNACSTGRSAQLNPFAGTAQHLVQHGVPAVIAMQFDVSDTAATELARGFYRALARGYPVDTALAQARKGVYIQENTLEWGTPVLFMRTPDGRLFDLPTHSDGPTPGPEPYLGLDYYDVEDAPRFFGREALTAELVTYLRDQRFLAVIGASGSGKSSLVRAGLVPALQRGTPLFDGTLPPTGSTRWPVHIITPKAHPLKELAASLTRNSDSDLERAQLINELAQDPRVLDLRVARLLTGSAADRLLLVVDQFEELFTLCYDPQERQHFVNNLLMAAASDGTTTVVITLRADFYHHCAAFAELRSALEHHQRYIGPMTEDELRRAIEEPARLGGWELEPGLVELLLDDVAAEPGALPLLSHALLETWKRRRGRMLILAGYAASGRVQGAIAQTAEAVLNQLLSAEQRPVARNIFVRLTKLGEGVQDTRRRVALAELLPKNATEANAVKTVLMALANARLITTDRDLQTGEEEVEVAHEALIREWRTLHEWLQDDREGLRIHRHLTEATQGWVARNHDPSELYRGTRLDQVLAWVESHVDDINEQEQAFIDASRAERQQEINEQERIQKEREDARERDLRQARRARNRALLALAAMAATLILSIVLLTVLYSQYRDGRAQGQARVRLEEANALKLALDAQGAIAKLKDAVDLDPTLEINLADEISDTRRYVATTLVQKGEALLQEAQKSGSIEIAYTSAISLFTKALTLAPPPDTPVYVWVPSGKFVMGSSQAEIDRMLVLCKEFFSYPCPNDLFEEMESFGEEIPVNGFWIMRTEVTNGQYKRCVDVDICTAPNNRRWANLKLSRQPVTNITWDQANAYAEWVGGRLPTEAEWEKACRGTDGRLYPWGNEMLKAEEVNYSNSPSGAWADIGSYPADISFYKLLDMGGNVKEWTSSKKQPYPYRADDGREDRDGSEPRVFRGGSFYITGLTYFTSFTYCAYRDQENPNRSYSNVGFRVVSRTIGNSK